MKSYEKNKRTLTAGTPNTSVNRLASRRLDRGSRLDARLAWFFFYHSYHYDYDDDLHQYYHYYF